MMVEQSAIEVKSHCLNVGHATKANSAIGIRQKRSFTAGLSTTLPRCVEFSALWRWSLIASCR